VGDPADADVPFAAGLLQHVEVLRVAAAGSDEGVSDDHGPGAGRSAVGEVGVDLVQGCGQHRPVGGGLRVQVGADHRRLEVGHAVHGDRAVGVFEEDRDVAGGGVGSQVDTGAGEQA
jgi:hypothetical protein